MAGNNSNPGGQDLSPALMEKDNGFTELFNRYKEPVRRIGERVLRRFSEVDDYVQDVFVKVYLHLTSIQNISQLRAYILRIAFNTALNKKQRDIPPLAADPAVLEQTLTDSRTPSPEKELEQGTIQSAIQNALAQLPARYRKILSLVYEYDIKYREIAELMDTPLGTVKSLVHRARNRLREILEQTLGLGNSTLSAALI